MAKNFKEVTLDDAANATSGRIQITPEIVERALDRISAYDDAFFVIPTKHLLADVHLAKSRNQRTE